MRREERQTCSREEIKSYIDRICGTGSLPESECSVSDNHFSWNKPIPSIRNVIRFEEEVMPKSSEYKEKVEEKSKGRGVITLIIAALVIAVVMKWR